MKTHQATDLTTKEQTVAEQVHVRTAPVPSPAPAPVPAPSISRPKEWFLVELWFENRALFKEIVKHIAIFAIFAAILEIYHRIHKSSQLPPEEVAWLNSIHFWGYIALLILLGVCLFIKVIVIEARGIRREK